MTLHAVFLRNQDGKVTKSRIFTWKMGEVSGLTEEFLHSLKERFITGLGLRHKIGRMAQAFKYCPFLGC
jgi:hypothetical protein